MWDTGVWNIEHFCTTFAHHNSKKDAEILANRLIKTYEKIKKEERVLFYSPSSCRNTGNKCG